MSGNSTRKTVSVPNDPDRKDTEMKHDQLYFPHLVPRLTNKLAISFLHWDSVLRIFPKKDTADFGTRLGIVKELEDAKILICENLQSVDIDQATCLFDRLMGIVEGHNNLNQRTANTLVRPLRRFLHNSEYYIYEGKANNNLEDSYPKYFKSGSDQCGNKVFYCTKATGLTYMTLLAHFLNKRKNYCNTITDQPDAFTLFIVLNKLLKLSPEDDSITEIVEAAEKIEKIFFIPLFKVLEPKQFSGIETMEKIIQFRANPNNEKLRKKYLTRIDCFLDDLKECENDDEVKETVEKHEREFTNQLKILIAACNAHGIPVNEKIVNHGKKSSWEMAGRLWNNANKVIDVVTKNVMSVIKPALTIKPSLDFYNNVLKESKDFYPLLIQENFSPTPSQRAFQRIQQLDKIEL